MRKPEARALGSCARDPHPMDYYAAVGLMRYAATPPCGASWEAVNSNGAAIVATFVCAHRSRTVYVVALSARIRAKHVASHVTEVRSSSFDTNTRARA